MPLLTLPTEVLYGIIEDAILTLLDLSKLTQTSQHLHFIVTPLLIKRGGINDVLLFAAQRGFASQTDHALSLGGNPDCSDPEFMCPALLWGAMGGHEAVVTLLLQHGADVRRNIACGWTALHWAVATGAEYETILSRVGYAARDVGDSFARRSALWAMKHRGLLYSPYVSAHRYVMDHDKTPAYFTPAPHLGRHPGHSAVIGILLDHGANINACDRDGKTALGRAVQLADVPSVRVLLCRGAGLDYGSIRFLTTLAAGSCEEQIFELLAPRERHTVFPEGEMLHVFLAAAASGNERVLMYLRTRGVSLTAADQHTGANALEIAVSHDQVSTVTLLLREGMDVNAPGREGRTTLHCARSPEMVTLLLSCGADPEAGDSWRQTPLHAMARMVDTVAAVACIPLLLTHGATIDALDRFDRTPLHRAVISSTLDVVTLLVHHNACISASDDHGLTPLHWAAMAQRLDLLQFLVTAGADITVRSERGRTILHMFFELWSVDVDPHYEEETVWIQLGGTCAYHGMFMGGRTTFTLPNCWEPVLSLLLRLGVDVEAVDDEGMTAADTATVAGFHIAEWCPRSW